MGWEEGRGLGKEETGRREHVVVTRKVGTEGLGMEEEKKERKKADEEVSDGFADVLRRIKAVGRDVKTKASAVKKTKKKSRKEAPSRSLDGRKKKRRDVKGYSERDKREIFGC